MTLIAIDGRLEERRDRHCTLSGCCVAYARLDHSRHRFLIIRQWRFTRRGGVDASHGRRAVYRWMLGRLPGATHDRRNEAGSPRARDMGELVGEKSCRGGVALVVSCAQGNFVTEGDSIGIVCSGEPGCVVASVDPNCVRVDSHERLEESP